MGVTRMSKAEKTGMIKADVYAEICTLIDRLQYVYGLSLEESKEYIEDAVKQKEI